MQTHTVRPHRTSQTLKQPLYVREPLLLRRREKSSLRREREEKSEGGHVLLGRSGFKPPMLAGILPARVARRNDSGCVKGGLFPDEQQAVE